MPAPLWSTPVYIVPQSLSGQPIYLDAASRAAIVSEISQLTPDANWQINRLGIGVEPAHRIHMESSGADEKDLYIKHNLQDGSGLVETYRPVHVEANYTATDIATSVSAWGGINSTFTFGNQGVAATGKARNLATNSVIQGAGNADNEYTPHFAVLRFDIGPDFDQVAVPTGRGWLTDWSVHGPIAVKPDMLNGQTILFNNYYNGSPNDSPSAAIWLVTKKSSGGALTDEHTAANTYPIDVGLGIVGDSNAGASAIGWTKAIQIGGFGSGWKESGSSYIGTGIDMRDHATFGIHIHDRHASGTGPAIAIAANGGHVLIGLTAQIDSNTKLEIISAANVANVMIVGSTSGTLNQSNLFRNGQGQMQMFNVGTAGTYLTASAAGDAGIRMTTSGKAFHLGGTTKIVTVTQDNKLGFFAATPIVQAVLATGAGATVDNVITALQNLGLVRQS